MSLWELNTLDMGTNTICDYCLETVFSWYDSEDIGKAICISCLDKGKRESDE